MSVRWYGDKMTKALRRKLMSNMDDAVKFLKGAIRYEISIPGPPRSDPGEAPHIDTSALMESYFHDTAQDPDTIGGRVGSTVPHSAYLELGTANMAPRPSQRSTLINEADTLATIICTT